MKFNSKTILSLALLLVCGICADGHAKSHKHSKESHKISKAAHKQHKADKKLAKHTAEKAAHNAQNKANEVAVNAKIKAN